MPLQIPNQDATQEEINAWIVETQEQYDKMEEDLSNANSRVQNLLSENNRLVAKVTGRKEENEEKEEDEIEIPFCINEETFKALSKKDIEELKNILEGEE